ncbi:hypothetical protein ANN_14047 [Periplaneta americana]|uniref:Uncharacterized protein n=1 Tax=Periplaneta americana TaxID=6978 RepID=A0ABQ8SWF1_PERAM|nr:hypothetical protein ANN_14047 [Periplaneta americana]
MSPGSSTESYPAFAHIGLRKNPGKNLNQVTCPDRESNPGHLVSRPDALTSLLISEYGCGYVAADDDDNNEEEEEEKRRRRRRRGRFAIVVTVCSKDVHSSKGGTCFKKRATETLCPSSTVSGAPGMPGTEEVDRWRIPEAGNRVKVDGADRSQLRDDDPTFWLPSDLFPISTLPEEGVRSELGSRDPPGRDPVEENRDNYFNQRLKASRKLRNKKKDYFKEKLNEVENSKNKDIQDLYKDIKKFKNGYQARLNVIKEGKDPVSVCDEDENETGDPNYISQSNASSDSSEEESDDNTGKEEIPQLILTEEQRLSVFENKLLRKIFGTKRDEVTGEWRKLRTARIVFFT